MTRSETAQIERREGPIHIPSSWPQHLPFKPARIPLQTTTTSLFPALPLPLPPFLIQYHDASCNTDPFARSFPLFSAPNHPPSVRHSIPFAESLCQPAEVEQSPSQQLPTPQRHLRFLTFLSATPFYSTRLVILNLSCTNLPRRVSHLFRGAF